MTIQNALESIESWVRDTLVPKINLLEPPKNNIADSNYTEKYINPAVYLMFIPSKDKLPPKVSTQLPAICIQMLEGSDDLSGGGTTTMDIRLAFASWRYGIYDNGVYVRNADGIKDALLMMELAKNELEKAVYLDGVKLDRNQPVSYGFFSEDNDLVNAYPEWYSYINFKVTYGIGAKTSTAFNDLI